MIKWKDSFSVKVEEIDKQHKELFNIGAEILAAIKSNEDNYDTIMELLNKLTDYTEFHFDYEKKAMEKIGKSLSDEHLQEHENFVMKLKEATTIDIDEKQKEVLLQMLNFIADWITKHILKTDKEYVGILK
ncbi:MAG: bacteriohemerythrin [Firmicutes bacterium]|jgi:hemerythrin|nr:bacteriohemerythrin [Bacillota bacterium]